MFNAKHNPRVGAQIFSEWGKYWHPTLTFHDPNPPITLENAEAAGSPFFQSDWSSARVGHGTRGFIDLTSNLLLTTLAVAVVVAPFGPIEWPERLGRREVVVDQSLNSLISTLAPVVETPFVQFDWPIIRHTATREEFRSQGLLQTTLLPPAAAAPFIPVDLMIQHIFPRRGIEVSLNLMMTTLAPLPPAPSGDLNYVGFMADMGKLMTR